MTRSRVLVALAAIALAAVLWPAAALASPAASVSATPAPVATVTMSPVAASDATATTSTTPVFDRNDIISDDNMVAASCMSAADIQTFLNGQPSYLKDHRLADHSGYLKYPAQMVYDAAQAWGISPKVILTTLQKEQSLLGVASPTQKALDWAMGCGVPDSGGRNLAYKGFGKQIWFGTKTLASHRAGWLPGSTFRVDNNATTVVPADASTWSLYSYTPWVSGNKSFWNLWQRYFLDDPKAASPAIGIAASPTSLSLHGQFVLFGALTDGADGDMCVVHVKKPGSAYWTVSSYRLAYGANSAYAYWWYRYTPKLRGTYQFYVVFTGTADRAAQTSKVVKVTVK